MNIVTMSATIITTLLGLLTLWAQIKKPISKILANNAHVDTAIRALLRTEIARIHREYMAMGKIDRMAREAVLNLHEQYKALGGNGNIDLDIEELIRLPVMMPEADTRQ